MSGTSVLIVDDDERMRRLARRVLEGEGHSCTMADCVGAARAALVTNNIALAVCDVRMPGESGLDLVRELHERHPDIAVMMASGDDDPQVAAAAAEYGAFGYLVKPYTARQLIIGVDNALHRRRLELENRHYREQLEQLVDDRTAELRVALDETRSSHVETINRLARAVEVRDSDTGGHIDRIGRLSALVATCLGLPQGQVEMLRLAAPMHDVGKLGIPDAILCKPGKLTRDERAVMERHAELGHEILAGSASELLEEAASIALTHHERWDGAGYPNGLAGADIPLEGRIVAAVDVFDALISNRVYRPALPVDEALQVVRDGSGSHFDPAVAACLVGLVERGELEPLSATRSV